MKDWTREQLTDELRRLKAKLEKLDPEKHAASAAGIKAAVDVVTALLERAREGRRG